jgi:hypothetical protein
MAGKTPRPKAGVKADIKPPDATDAPSPALVLP